MSFTSKLEQFLDNNTPGGYVKTNTNISMSDIEPMINQKINSMEFLTASSTIPVSHISGLESVATTGMFSDLHGVPPFSRVTISDTLEAASGRTKLATITIDGVSTDIYGASSGSGGSGGISEESDPIFSASPAASITANDIANWNNNTFPLSPAYTISIDDIENWNNKSDFEGHYEEIIGFSTIFQYLPKDNNDNVIYTAIPADIFLNQYNFDNTYNNIEIINFSEITNNNALQNFGTNNFVLENCFNINIINYPGFSNLEELLLICCNKIFYSNKKYYFQSSNGLFDIIEVTPVFNENDNIIYYSLLCQNISNNIQNVNQTYQDVTDRLNNLQFTNKTFYILYDINESILYVKQKT